VVLTHEEDVGCRFVQGAIRYSEGVVHRRELSCKSVRGTQSRCGEVQVWGNAGVGKLGQKGRLSGMWGNPGAQRERVNKRCGAMQGGGETGAKGAALRDVGELRCTKGKGEQKVSGNAGQLGAKGRPQGSLRLGRESKGFPG
jgi:hypothetical protein